MSGILCLCLGASTAISITFVSLFPRTPDTPSFQQEVLRTTGVLSLTGVSLIITVQLFRFIWNKKRYHENQTILWPMRCIHCAFILGLPAERLMNTLPGEGDVNVRRLHSTACLHHVHYENPVSHDNRGRNGYGEMWTDSASSPNDLLDANVQDHPRNGYMYRRRSRSFLKIYGVVLIFTLLVVALDWVSQLTCFVLGSEQSKVSLIARSIQAVIYLVMIPVTMQFAINYYDAVFVTTRENMFTMVLFVSGAVWMAVYRIADPVSKLYNTPNTPDSGPCRMNSTYAKEAQTAILMLKPFRSECAIIALCILWHMWVSFLCKSSLPIARAHMSEKDIFQGDSCIYAIKNCALGCQAYLTGRQDCESTLLHPSIQDLQKSLRKVWILSTLFSVMYFIFRCNIELGNPFKYNVQYDSEIMWSIDILFILPLFILHMQNSYVSRHSQETFTPVSPRKVEAHDVLLLLCSGGMFCHFIICLAAGSGLLISDPTEAILSQLKALATFSIVHSLVNILAIWVVTAFLLQVQGISMMNICEIKWALVCLIYISLSNGTCWLSENIKGKNTWYLKKAFFGEMAGNVICTLLEPFFTLYGIHAAVVAYETYKSILQETINKYTMHHRPNDVVS